MSATVISLKEYRELLQRIEAEALEEDPLAELRELDIAINESLIWLDITKSCVLYTVLYCIQGSKKSNSKNGVDLIQKTTKLILNHNPNGHKTIQNLVQNRCKIDSKLNKIRIILVSNKSNQFVTP